MMPVCPLGHAYIIPKDQITEIGHVLQEGRRVDELSTGNQSQMQDQERPKPRNSCEIVSSCFWPLQYRPGGGRLHLSGGERYPETPVENDVGVVTETTFAVKKTDANYFADF